MILSGYLSTEGGVETWFSLVVKIAESPSAVVGRALGQERKRFPRSFGKVMITMGVLTCGLGSVVVTQPCREPFFDL